MFKKIGIILLFVVAVGARHAVPLQGLAFADSYTQNGQPCPPECVSDSMEIETYYPSPYGYYEELRGDKIIVGDSDNSYINETDLPPTGTITFEPVSYASVAAGTNLYEGTMYYDKNDHKFRYYDNTGSDSTKYWKDLGGGGGDYWKPSTANSNDIYYNTGNVGIGVGESDTVGAKLQINTSADIKGLVVKSAAVASSAITQFFNYTGDQQTYTVPVGITQVTIVAYGASGGNGGGLGGQATATVSVTPGETLYIYVGGQGGYNGGGAGSGNAAGGGGASDVRQGGNNFVNRIIVAGGSGGSGGGGRAGGGGGGGGTGGGSVAGGGGAGDGNAGSASGRGGGGGSSSVVGAGGGGGTGGGSAGGGGSSGGGGSGGEGYWGGGGGGGGGGYWGGGGGGGAGEGFWYASGGGGGGGSGYVTGTNTSMVNGVRSGNGQVIITPAGVGNIAEWQDVSGTVLGVVKADGSVGIKTATPDYTLTVNGTAWVTSGSWTGSDLRWKKNIEPLPDNTIDRLIKLDTIYYNYNNELFQDMRFPSGRQIGLSAQNVEKQFPELVLTDKDGYKAVAYDKLGAVTIEAIKEQQKEIEQLKESLRAQEEKSRENQDKLRKQQKEIELLKAGRL